MTLPTLSYPTSLQKESMLLLPKTNSISNRPMKNYITKHLLCVLFKKNLSKEKFLHDKRINAQTTTDQMIAVFNEHNPSSILQTKILVPFVARFSSFFFPLHTRSLVNAISDDLKKLSEKKEDFKKKLYFQLNHFSQALEKSPNDPGVQKELQEAIIKLIQHYLCQCGPLFEAHMSLKTRTKNEMIQFKKMLLLLSYYLLLPIYLLEKYIKKKLVEHFAKNLSKTLFNLPKFLQEFHKKNPHVFICFIDKLMIEFLSKQIELYKSLPPKSLASKALETGASCVLDYISHDLHMLQLAIQALQSKDSTELQNTTINLFASAFLPSYIKTAQNIGRTLFNPIYAFFNDTSPKDLRAFSDRFMTQFNTQACDYLNAIDDDNEFSDVTDDVDEEEYFDATDDESDDQYFDPCDSCQDVDWPAPLSLEKAITSKKTQETPHKKPSFLSAIKKISSTCKAALQKVKSIAESMAESSKKFSQKACSGISSVCQTVIKTTKSLAKFSFDTSRAAGASAATHAKALIEKTTKALIDTITPIAISRVLPAGIDAGINFALSPKGITKIDEAIQKFFEQAPKSTSDAFLMRRQRNEKIKEFVSVFYHYQTGLDVGSSTIANTAESLIVDTLDKTINQCIHLTENERVVRSMTLALLKTCAETLPKTF